MKWPPDFEAENERRELVQKIINSTSNPRETAKEYYADNPVQFIKDCCITYDPRNPSKKLPAKMPFIPFPKQVELINWLKESLELEEDGLIEKSRDMGATWLACSFSVWLYLYVPGSSVGWGSRKEQLVDRIGDPDSIFEKIRMIIRHLPWYVLPENFKEKDHLTYMKCLNPDNYSTIVGEAGDNIGRGGRKSIYFKDESAHYERAELIEAALGDNTNVQIDISSVNGEGNVFYRKRMGGIVRVFVMDWSDHPAKSKKWHEKRKAKAVAEGLEAEFAQEVDRDYSSAVEGIMIPAKYVRACLDAHIKLDIKPKGERKAGLDVADEGGDKNAYISMHGCLITNIDQWGEGTTDYTAKKANELARKEKLDELTYDSVGVGAGVKGTLSSLNDDKKLPYEVVAFSGGGGVVNPDDEYDEDKTNADMFKDLNAQSWWRIRDMCLHTYQAVVEGKEYDEGELLCIPSNIKYAEELISELSRPKKQYDPAGRVKRESKKDMKKRGINSPNLADALIMCNAPKETAATLYIG